LRRRFTRQQAGIPHLREPAELPPCSTGNPARPNSPPCLASAAAALSCAATGEIGEKILDPDILILLIRCRIDYGHVPSVRIGVGDMASKDSENIMFVA
jgi:hypothetical protein